MKGQEGEREVGYRIGGGLVDGVDCIAWHGYCISSSQEAHANAAMSTVYEVLSG